MVITITSLAFLSQSDVELACGRNMNLRMQMDYVAQSGAEHAKGLILNPHDIDIVSEYWRGGVGQQIVGGDDYYDVEVVRDETDRCNYIIDCNAYRLKNGEKIGRSSISAQLRLDPCIAYWVGTNTTISQQVTINGDVYCNGTLTNGGVINGDVFANGLSGSITGQQKAVGDLSLGWPRVTVEDFTSNYPVQTVGASLSGVTFGPYNPVQVCYSNGDLELVGAVQIEGMLVVEGNLTIQGNGNVIRAGKNLPALLVTGDVMIEGGGELEINGLAVVEGQVQLSSDDADVSILGGLFTEDGIVETTEDSSGNDNTATLYNGPSWHPSGGQTGGGALEFDGVDDTVEEPGAGSYINGLSAVTFSLWVKSDVTFQDRGIMFSRDPTDADADFGIRYDRTGTYGGGIRVIKASIRTTSGYTQIESTSNVQTTSWQHLALVWESGSGLKLYINGAKNPLTYELSTTLSGSISGVQKLMLGRGTKAQYWDGMIDDVRIYDRALDPNDIYPPTDGPAGLIGHWRLDDSGSSSVNVTAAPCKTAIVLGSSGGVEERWGQAAGAFFKSIRRE